MTGRGHMFKPGETVGILPIATLENGSRRPHPVDQCWLSNCHPNHFECHEDLRYRE